MYQKFVVFVSGRCCGNAFVVFGGLRKEPNIEYTFRVAKIVILCDFKASRVESDNMM